MSAGYKIEVVRDAFGQRHNFSGPGISQYANGVHLMQSLNDWAREHFTDSYTQADADTVQRLLEAAFEAGRKAGLAEVRKALGL